VSIQGDILDTIGPGGVEVSALRERLGNIGANELDLAINALIRARRVRVVMHRYEVIPSTRPLGGMPHTGRPPSAEEEATASLLPVTRTCVTCGPPAQALCEFRLVGPGDARAKECNSCHAKKTTAGLSKQRGRRATVNGGSGEDSAPIRHKADLPDGAKPSPTSSAPSFEGAKINTVRNGSGGEEHGDTSDSRHSSSAAATQPVIADRVLDRVKAQKQAGLNRIATLEVDLANERSRLGECEEFLRLYARFAQGAGS